MSDGSDPVDPSAFDVSLVADGTVDPRLRGLDYDQEHHALIDLVNRLLDKGVVITGDVTISVAGVDLVYLGLNAVLTSVATAGKHLGRPIGRRDGWE